MILNRIGVLCILIVTNTGWCGTQQDNLVVMIRAYKVINSTPQGVVMSGAGIVASQTKTRIVILTACHVVMPHPDSGESPWKVEVEFRPIPGKGFAAEVQKSYCSNDYDYTVIFVYPTATQALVPEVLTPASRGLVSKIEGDELRGKKVQVVGFMGGQSGWQARQNVIESAVVDTVQLKDAVEPGASGGGLFDENGLLVGMIRASNGAAAEATPIRFLIDLLKRKQIEVGLQFAVDDLGRNPLCENVDPPIEPCLFRR